jgi:oligoendopeptidase F
MLLADYMIAHARTREQKILALDRELDLLRYSYFAVMSEVQYELNAHEAVDRGEAVTGKDLNKMYCAPLKHAVLADTGSTKFDDSACFGWASRPGIYYDFYFYKYLTAVSAAGFFVDALETHEPDVRKRFFELLRAGGSDDPYVLLRRAGFDAASPAAYQPIVQRMNRLVAQLEATAERH